MYHANRLNKGPAVESILCCKKAVSLPVNTLPRAPGLPVARLLSELRRSQGPFGVLCVSPRLKEVAAGGQQVQGRYQFKIFFADEEQGLF